MVSGSSKGPTLRKGTLLLRKHGGRQPAESAPRAGLSRKSRNPGTLPELCPGTWGGGGGQELQNVL